MKQRYGHEQEAFDVLCRRVLTTAGGRVERNDLGRLVADELGSEGYLTATWGSFVARVVQACRAHDSNGLPRAQSFGGEVVQRQLWTSDEYAQSIRDRRKTIRAESAIIKRLRAECLARPAPSAGISGRCRQFVEALKSRPGQWALYPTPMSSAGSATTYRGQYPEVEWTVRVRPDRKYDMYGRWVGEAKP